MEARFATGEQRVAHVDALAGLPAPVEAGVMASVRAAVAGFRR